MAGPDYLRLSELSRRNRTTLPAPDFAEYTPLFEAKPPPRFDEFGPGVAAMMLYRTMMRGTPQQTGQLLGEILNRRRGG